MEHFRDKKVELMKWQVSKIIRATFLNFVAEDFPLCRWYK